jgi:hypothetical protein
LVDYLFDSPPFDEDSVPSRTTYEGWIGAGTEIVVECAVRRWRGSFYERETRRVKAL